VIAVRAIPATIPSRRAHALIRLRHFGTTTGLAGGLGEFIIYQKKMGERHSRFHNSQKFVFYRYANRAAQRDNIGAQIHQDKPGFPS